MVGFLQNNKESHQNTVKKTKGQDIDWDNILKIYQKKSLCEISITKQINNKKEIKVGNN